MGRDDFFIRKPGNATKVVVVDYQQLKNDLESREIWSCYCLRYIYVFLKKN